MPPTDPPGFLAIQRQFAAHIRNPDLNPSPPGIEPERMSVYVDLFHRNIGTFLANGFPRAKAALSAGRWRALVQGFIHRHGSESPYFLDIAQEFMTFLDTDSMADRPDWLLELCHYEWVERSLRMARPEIPAEGIDRDGDLLAGEVVVSPLIVPLCYRFRVHEITPQQVPQGVPGAPAWLIACRRRDDTVGFIASNALTHRLVEILKSRDSGEQALVALSSEYPDIDPKRLRREGADTLERLRDAQVLLGVRA